MKKPLSALIAVILVAALAVSLFGCTSQKKISVAVPSEQSALSRALVLLRDLGYIALGEADGEFFTLDHVAENPHRIEFDALCESDIVERRAEYDYVVLTGDSAYSYGIDAKSEALAQESLFDDHTTLLIAKNGAQKSDAALALKAAVESEEVESYIKDEYSSMILPCVANATDGYNKRVDYSGLAETKITVGVTKNTCADILSVAREILLRKNITLETVAYETSDSLLSALCAGGIDLACSLNEAEVASYNALHDTDLVTVCDAYSSALCVFGGAQTTLDLLKGN